LELIPSGPPLLAGVVRSLKPVIVRCGIASDEQLRVAGFHPGCRETL